MYRLGNQLYSGELVYRRGAPLLVVSWRTVERRRAPYISFRLDPEKLRRVPNRPGHYLYEGDLADERPVS